MLICHLGKVYNHLIYYDGYFTRPIYWCGIGVVDLDVDRLEYNEVLGGIIHHHRPVDSMILVYRPSQRLINYWTTNILFPNPPLAKVC